MMLGLSTAAFAGDPKTETKDAKATVAPVSNASPAKAKTDLFTYYVTQVDPMNSNLYDINSTGNDNCGTTGSSPCEITSTSQITGNTVSKSAVDGQTGGFAIVTQQTTFP